MKKNIIFPALLVSSLCCIHIACKEKSIPPEQAIEQTIISQVDSFSSLCLQMKSLAENQSSGDRALQQLFLEARLSYKSFEWAAEYFEPLTAQAVNGPPVQEVEASGQVIEPSGLQVMEGLLFPAYDRASKIKLLRQIETIQTSCDKYKNRFVRVPILKWQIFEAAKLELFRIETLGITGFDNPLTQQSIQESGAALEGLQKLFTCFGKEEDAEKLINKFISTKIYISGHPDFDRFDRMEFITDYCNPITTGISELGNKLDIRVVHYNRLLNQDAKTLFDSNAFNVNAFAPDHSSFISKEKTALGKLLFSDPMLSGSGSRSCKSCHQPGRAFTDGMAKNTIIGKNELLDRNTPTLINAALQPALFYDLRVNTLEDQSVNVVQSRNEMHGSMLISVKRLWADMKYRQMFLTAFPHEDNSRIDTFEIMNAIGSYIRSLVLLNSRFDQHMRGDRGMLNSNEINGFNLFMGKAKCATCHFMPLFNGTFPPRFNKIETEVIGVPKSIKDTLIDPDMGRYAIFKVESFKHAFKTPTIRNAALTAPYMHNGIFNTLEQVMDFYNRGGGIGLGIKIENQTLPFDSLSLTTQEQADIISFIKSLNSQMPKSICHPPSKFSP